MFECIHKLLRKDVLVKLPDYTEDSTRLLKSGLYVSAIQEAQRYAPTHGEVVMIADETQNVKVGDVVFFGNWHWGNAKTRAMGSNDERFKKTYFGHKEFAIMDTTGFYMTLPESYILFIKRGEEIIPINDYVIATPLPKDTQEYDVLMGGVITKVRGNQSGLIIAPDLKSEKYVENVAVIYASPDDELQRGDIVHTLKHCDIFVENDMNNPILPEGYFFIEKDDIVAKQLKA